jgi:hypothetical protein
MCIIVGGLLLATVVGLFAYWYGNGNGKSHE